MPECVWSLERRARKHRDPFNVVTERIQVRFVCSCGKATHWYLDHDRAGEDRDKHALDGQQTLPM